MNVTTKSVAYHEAGHAVMAVLCGVEVWRATIAPVRNKPGHVVINEPVGGYLPLDRLMICLAGDLAEGIAAYGAGIDLRLPRGPIAGVAGGAGGQRDQRAAQHQSP